MKIQRKSNIIKIVFAIVIAMSVLLSSVVAYAGTAIFEAVKPTYKTTVNGVEVSDKEIMNIDGRTYIQPTALEPFGVTNEWREDTRTAEFTIPEGSESSSITELNELSKQNVRFYKNSFTQSNFVGNGVFVSEDEILTTAKFIPYGGQLKAIDYKGDQINIKVVPIKKNSRLALYKTNGYKVKNVSTIAETRPEKEEGVIFSGSLAEIPSMLTLTSVKDYYSFNAFTTGDKDHMRIRAKLDNSVIGSGIFNTSCELVGMYLLTGGNYGICVTTHDIQSFLD